MEFNDPLIAVFVFAIGACVGSFLNVVVYRLPIGRSLITPPSACPKCGHKLAAWDNIPVLGWLLLRGKCRYCHEPISPRYPLVELVTGLLFVGHYWMLFHLGWGPYDVRMVQSVFGTWSPSVRLLSLDHDWPLLLMHLWLIAALLAASLIDLELFIIPLELCWMTAGVGLVGHALGRPAGSLGGLHFGPVVDAMTLGGAIGLSISIALVHFGLMRRSFHDDEPLLEKDLAELPEADRPDPWPPRRIRAEMRREMLYVLLPLAGAVALGALVMYSPRVAAVWGPISQQRQLSGLLGSLAGGLIGGAVVWFFRIAGSYGFGREAMGLGDVHLMLGVGCVVGPGAATVAFFLAPAAGLVVALAQLFLKGRKEIPYGPYLSLATLAVMLFYTPIYAYLEPGMMGLAWAIQSLFQSGQAAGSVTNFGGSTGLSPAGTGSPITNGSLP